MMTEKLCTKCSTIKTIDCFSRKSKRLGHFQAWCKPCRSKYCSERSKTPRGIELRKKYAKENKDRINECRRIWHSKMTEEQKKNKYYREFYGWSYDQILKLLADQNETCTICSEDIKDGWHVDHDHATNHIRGLLCSSCNITLGFAKENTKRLMGCASYIRFHKKLIDGRVVSTWKGMPAGGLPCSHRSTRKLNGKK